MNRRQQLPVAVVVALCLAGCTRPPVTHQAARPGAQAAPSRQTQSPSMSPSMSPSPSSSPNLNAAGVPSASPTAAASAGYRYAFPVGGCPVRYAHVHHDYPATDIFAARGCAFVAVVDGHVDEATAADAWSPSANSGASRGGLSVSIIGIDRVRYYGSHLSSVAVGIGSGATVHAGQLLGRVGDSGDARGVGTHVHFGISWPSPPGVWWVRRGELYPWPYLDSWLSRGSLSPAPAIRALEAQRGTIPKCRIDC